jgi:hypothetical protein
VSGFIPDRSTPSTIGASFRDGVRITFERYRTSERFELLHGRRIAGIAVRDPYPPCSEIMDDDLVGSRCETRPSWRSAGMPARSGGRVVRRVRSSQLNVRAA